MHIANQISNNKPRISQPILLICSLQSRSTNVLYSIRISPASSRPAGWFMAVHLADLYSALLSTWHAIQSDAFIIQNTTNRNTRETAGCVPSSAATRSASSTQSGLFTVYLLSLPVLLLLHVLRLQCDDTTAVRSKLAVQFDCRIDVFVFTAIQTSW